MVHFEQFNNIDNKYLLTCSVIRAFLHLLDTGEGITGEFVLSWIKKWLHSLTSRREVALKFSFSIFKHHRTYSYITKYPTLTFCQFQTHIFLYWYDISSVVYFVEMAPISSLNVVSSHGSLGHKLLRVQSQLRSCPKTLGDLFVLCPGNLMWYHVLVATSTCFDNIVNCSYHLPWVQVSVLSNSDTLLQKSCVGAIVFIFLVANTRPVRHLVTWLL